jgi:hypothetical protein
MRAILVLAMCAGAMAATALPAGAARSCGSVKVRFTGASAERYPVKVVQGRVTCARARTVLRRYMSTGRPPRHWICALGHSGQPWAAACATVTKKIVRAYNPR